jgi:lipocalin-like protein
MRSVLVFLLVAFLALPFSVAAQRDNPPSIPQEFLGTWKLVSYVRQDIPSGTKSDVMGPHPQGYISYGGDGRMIVMIVGSNRQKPAAAVATPAESAALLKSMLAYAGTFTVDTTAKTVTHHVEISWDESRTGTDHVRRFKLEGNTLKLTTDPSADPSTGEKTTRELIWERAH